MSGWLFWKVGPFWVTDLALIAAVVAANLVCARWLT